MQPTLFHAGVPLAIGTAVQADAVEFVAGLPNGSIDLTLTDPAYASLEKHRATGTTTRLTGAWFQVFADERVPALAEALWHAHRSETFAIVICDPDSEPAYRAAFRSVGWWWWSSWTWFKVDAARMQKNRQAIIEALDRGDPATMVQLMADVGMGYHGRRAHERAVLFERCATRQALGRLRPTGKRAALQDRATVDVLAHCVVKGGYPTEKPQSLMEQLIRLASAPDAVVCDPFLGAGTTAAAAENTGRRWVGCDLSAAAVTHTNARLAQ